MEEGPVSRERLIETYSVIKIRYKFNFDLSDDQLDIIEAVINGKDALGVLPTGAGKSMCFILPPLINGHIKKKHYTALVMSPLLALSRDQVNDLKKRGVDACMLTEACDAKAIQRGAADLIFAPPEALQVEKHLNTIKNYRTKICVQVYDEAHCVSEWGQDFRPAYRDLTKLRSLVRCPALALTATITKKIHRDLVNVLCLNPDTVVVATLPDRPNIFLWMRTSTSKFEAELQWVQMHLQFYGKESSKIIIYTRSINQCSAIYQWLLSSTGLNVYPGKDTPKRMVEMFHAHIDEESRARIIEQFPRADSIIRVLVCTIAFGMGMDIPDVRVVVLWGLPKTTLDYWQETGRCCRDPSLNGISVCYSYPASKTTCTDPTMKKVDESTTCTRQATLDQFQIDGMKGKLPEKISCGNACVSACDCDFCRCCEICLSACSCPLKRSKPTLLEDFLNQIRLE